MKIVFIVFIVVGSFAQSSTLCLNYFSKRPVFNAQMEILSHIDTLMEILKSKPSGAMMGGNSSRLTKFISDSVWRELNKIRVHTENMVGLDQVFGLKDSILAISSTLNAAYKNATAADLQILQAFRDKMLQVDRYERVKLAEEILEENLPDNIITYFEFMSENTNRSFKRVVEKYYQLKYQFKLLDAKAPDIAMMAILTNFALQTQNVPKVARIYAISEFKVLQKFGLVPEDMKLTLILIYMSENLNFHVEKTYDFYFQLRNGVNQNQSPVIMLPGPQ